MSTSQEPALDIVKAVYDAVERGDLDRVVSMLDENVEWIEPPGAPYGGTYHGPDAVVNNLFSNLRGEWEEFTVEPERFVADDGTVVALVTHRGVHAETGDRFEAPIADVWDVEDGQVTRLQHFIGDIDYVTERTS